MQFINLMPPKLDQKTNELVLQAGADLTLDGYRIDPSMAVVFQVIYFVRFESNDKLYNDKYRLAEFHYLPEVDNDNVKD